MTEFPFIKRINLPDNLPPVRAYVHRVGMDEGIWVNEPEVYLKNQLNAHLGQAIEKYDFSLMVMWGMRKNMGARVRNIDIFGFYDPKTTDKEKRKGQGTWRPESLLCDTLVLSNGGLSMERKWNSPVDQDITELLKREETYRATTPYFAFYTHVAPVVGMRGLMARNHFDVQVSKRAE